MTIGETEERSALDDVLKSGILDRSQNLQRLLLYVCEKHFEGKDDQVKEYTIATEALGRTENFDQKKDSIVRVEVHRLRKRLNQYYLSTGKERPVQIVIPEGKYVPHFVRRTSDFIPAPGNGYHGNAVEKVASPAVVPMSPVTPRLWKTVGLIAGLIVISIGMFVFFSRSKVQAPQPAAKPLLGAEPLNASADIRILAGRTAKFVDHQGNTWEPDQYVTGGISNTTSHPAITSATDQEMFAGHREGEFRYDIPLESGYYELRLYFAETVFGEGNPAGGGESIRYFDVLANGKLILDDLDILADAPGARVADIRVFKNIQPAEDGKLHLEFKSSMHNEPLVNAIEIRRASLGRIRPVRLVSQALAVRDSQGQLWEPDLYVEGGQAVKRQKAPENTVVPEIYRGERFGAFRYSIPVATDGVYKISLHFHEAWFGPGANGSGGEGSRIFDVYLNHQTILSNFDLFRAAGGGRRAYVRSISGVKPNSRGKIVLEFEPTRNYACINAIEVLDETPTSGR